MLSDGAVSGELDLWIYDTSDHVAAVVSTDGDRLLYFVWLNFISALNLKFSWLKADE